MDGTNYNYSDDIPKPPSPVDIDKFLPWACAQLQNESKVVVIKTKQEEYVSVGTYSERAKSRIKSRPKLPSQVEFSSDIEKGHCDTLFTPDSDFIFIKAIYDSFDNLVQIKFEKNKIIPRIIFQIIGLVIQYYIHLTNLTITSGIDQYSAYEISKFLPLSNITDLCLDNTYLRNPNYQILLEKENFIRHLSLSRCSIDDFVVEAIAATLRHPLPASKTLSILNLSSNRISDEGAKFLSNALRSNRQLSYLNISDNMLTDFGATFILETLMDFPLYFSELLASRSRRISYLKEKNELANRIARELRAGDLDRRSLKRKPVKTAPKKTKAENETSFKSVPEPKSVTSFEGFFERATILAENSLGEFKDPYNKMNTYVKDNIVYCFGNNTLCYLNMAYNNLTYGTITRLLDVLIYQRDQNQLDPTHRGLVNISLEGNLIPDVCEKLILMDQILSDGLSFLQGRGSISKKRRHTKSTH